MAAHGGCSPRGARMLRLLAMSLALFALQPGHAGPAGAAPGVRDVVAANLDPSVDPGVDFFSYANGGWLRLHPIPATETTWGIGNLVRDELDTTLRDIHERAARAGAPAGSEERRIGDFWRTALDEALARRRGIAPIGEALAGIGRIEDARQAVAQALRLREIGVEAFFQVSVDQDEKESATYSFHLGQGGLGLPDRDFYFNDEEGVRRIREAYVAHLARSLVRLGGAKGGAGARARAVMDFETGLARASRKLEDLRDPDANYHRIAPAQLQKEHTPAIDWAAGLDGWGMHPAWIAVGQPEYLDALARELAAATPAVLRDYLALRLLATYAETLDPETAAENFDFYQRTLAGRKEAPPRWKRLLEIESANFSIPDPVGMMVGRRYAQERFPEAARQRYLRMVAAIEDAYRERIGRLAWMGEETRKRALEKLASVDRKVGYPDRWPDVSALAIGTDSWCANAMAVERWRFALLRSRLGAPVDRAFWTMTPQTYNAQYSPSNNDILVPAAIVAYPGFADGEIDDAVAYGYVGASTIGHEITHGFDDEGRKFDAEGNLRDWWTAQDAARFEERAAVLARQFDAYEPLAGLHVNGRASLGENLADFGGLLLGLDAFRKTEQYRKGEPIAGLTPLQRFFLGYAYGWMDQEREERLRRRLLSNVHAPPKYRVNGPLSNIPEFHEAFGVKPGQPMWRAPGERVSVW
jgi:putative endopeptidase